MTRRLKVLREPPKRGSQEYLEIVGLLQGGKHLVAGTFEVACPDCGEPLQRFPAARPAKAAYLCLCGYMVEITWSSGYFGGLGGDAA